MIVRALFAIAALAAIAGSIMTISAKKPIRGAMALLLSILGVVGLLVGLHAQFLATVELIIYAGAVVVLFVFVVMLIGPDPSGSRDWRAIVSRTIAGLAVGTGAVAVAVALSRTSGLARMPAAHTELGTVEMFARELFGRGLVAFEVMTVLFIAAVVGVMALVSKKGAPRGSIDRSKEGQP
jgi:NADH-quinone oxidoreductase subunit J